MVAPVSKLDDIISGVIEREGGAKATNDPNDPGGRTQYGISERANPDLWADGKVTEDEARERYLAKYVVYPKYHTIPPSHPATQEQLIDWGVNSGPNIATQELQKILGTDQDGDLGPVTLKLLLGVDDRTLNNLLVAARVKMIARVVQRNPSQVKWLGGLLNRALSFLK